MERTQMILQHNAVQDPFTLPVEAAAWHYWRLPFYLENRIGERLLKTTCYYPADKKTKVFAVV